ncbi:hypothetical protein MPTK1_5g18270 [Marchantia polymorpha subsp. ruderalis]|uniref:MACPF domain-containing protein n=3 Tax=Marchantia polymorpha TaxID=3197 RepID=A0AAF6BJP1_MARPO|nr:hypothetical protein MARPO_0084s0075 [Marchantia polymorpha]BBN12225.1 hypothetical protein Mp_5g18270 [Marchantia polymorpha subsp. ruderalis]|eukprot:PTQ34013.1 hypothetical protein MARPO_0084s0075 [Marchantia polymorpha]
MADKAYAMRPQTRNSGQSKIATPAEKIAYEATQALGRGFDVTTDFRVGSCKGSCLVELDEENLQDLITPTGVVIQNVSREIKLDKGERTRYKSDVVSFQQMSERFNQGASITGKMPLGLFNNMYSFSGPWQADANATKGLALDGWFITLYSLQITRSSPVLIEDVKKAVPTIWDPKALASFIEKYGTHIVVSVKVGGKDVIYVRQHQTSPLQPPEVAKLMQKFADQRFQSVSNGTTSFETRERAGKEKVSDSYSATSVTRRSPLEPTYTTTRVKSKEDVEIICRRRGGNDMVENHHDWVATVPDSPDIIAMTFVPINALLNGVAGSGFLSHAVNLYLRYKPPIEELQYFLEYQIPKQWSPVFDLPLGPPRKEPVCPSLQFSLMGPKLYVSTSQVSVGRRPVTGLRLFLEGKKCNRLAIHLQHLSSLPKILQPYWDTHVSIGAPVWKEPEEQDSRWFEPVQWKNFSHVSTAPVENSDSWVGEASGTFVVTGAQLQVWNFGMKNVLFLRLLYSKVPGCSIRRSLWDHTPAAVAKSGLLRTFGLSGPFPPTGPPGTKHVPINQNSAIFPGAPKRPAPNPKLLKYVDMTEMTKGAQDMPGHWLVTGAKLDVETGKISIRVKYSLLHYEGGPSGSFSS